MERTTVHSLSWKEDQVVSSPAFCPSRVNATLEVGCSELFQSGLKKFQGRRQCSLSGQPAPVLHYPHSKAGFPYQSQPLSLELMSIFSQPPVVQSLALFPHFSTDLHITASKLQRRHITEDMSKLCNLKTLNLLHKPPHA